MRERSKVDPTPILGTEDGADMFFSPDGEWMGFFSAADSTLKRIPVSGGPAQTICRIDGQSRGASWGSDGVIVFATNISKGLMRVPYEGGEPQSLTKTDGNDATQYIWPEVLPDGRGVLFTVRNGSPERARIAVVSASDGRVTMLIGGTYPRFARSGHLLFALAGTVRAVRFDAARLAVVGDPVAVVDDVGVTPLGGAQYALGADGALVYATAGARLLSRTLVWVDRQGREEAINAPPRAYAYVRLSPDGSRIALDVRDQQTDIWIWDLNRKTLQNLTLDPGLDRLPVWTPDGARVAFSSAPSPMSQARPKSSSVRFHMCRLRSS
jgi:serine/threonine-protein kinase